MIYILLFLPFSCLFFKNMLVFVYEYYIVKNDYILFWFHSFKYVTSFSEYQNRQSCVKWHNITIQSAFDFYFEFGRKYLKWLRKTTVGGYQKNGENKMRSCICITCKFSSTGLDKLF